MIYIERVEILDAWALNISDYLAAKRKLQPNYRSAETGYSFSDLYEIYIVIYRLRYSADLFAYIGTKRLQVIRKLLLRSIRVI